MYDSEYMDVYNELIEMMIANPEIMYAMLIGSVIAMAICMVVCFFIARSGKLTWKYTFFGLLGMTGVLIVLCRSMAKSAGLSPYFMWLGLFGIYGIIIMAVVMFVKGNKRPVNQDTDQNQQWNHSESWEQRYEEGRRSREEEQTRGYNLNGEYHESDNGTICLSCGAAVAPGETVCPRCGNRVR